jgi:hypothetical protein
MTEQLQVGEYFHFVEPQKGGQLDLGFTDHDPEVFLVPEDELREDFDAALFGDSTAITTEDIFLVINAYQTTRGSWVLDAIDVATRIKISLLQKTDDPAHEAEADFLREVVKVPAPMDGGKR